MRHKLIAVVLGIASAVPSFAVETPRKISLEDFRDRMQGAWIGQSVGVAYGWPTEFRYKGCLAEDTKMPVWKPEQINETFNQDDLYVEMTFISTLLKRGVEVSTREAGIDFANSSYRLWCANDNARNNLRKGIAAPASSHPAYHPTTDDIDYQIESDFSGILAPGLPQASVDLGETFGRIMNYGDGLYAGQFVGAMYAEAYFATDRVQVVECALRAIPSQSKYAAMVRDMLSWYKSDPKDWRGTWRKAVDKYQSEEMLGRISFKEIDVKINGAMALLGLLYGEGDMDRTMYIATAGGYDSDCNPSTACGVLGTMIGFRRLDAKFHAALSKTNRWEFTDFNWDGLVSASERLARQLVRKYGGSVVNNASGGEAFLIPRTPVRPSPFFDSKAPGSVPKSVRLTDGERARIRYLPCKKAGEQSVMGTSVSATVGCVTQSEGRKIRVACIGDSITWGTAMTNRVNECYPAQLQRLLGDGYEVRNFGNPESGVYLNPPKRPGRWTPHPWRGSPQSESAYAYRPDIVISNLGINDSELILDEYTYGTNGMPRIEAGLFAREYTALLRAFERDGKMPRIIMWTRLSPLGKNHRGKGSPGPFVMEHSLRAVAASVGAETLDMYTPLLHYAETEHFAADGVHPEGVAQRVIAEITAKQIQHLTDRLPHGGPSTQVVDGVEWTYDVIDGKAQLRSCSGCGVKGRVTVPSTLGGCPVTCIGSRVFPKHADLTSVTILPGVTSIGRRAFGWCKNLASVTIPASVTNIDDFAFSGCMRLKSVAIPPDASNIGERAFEYCEGLTSLTIPSGVKCVRPYTFYSCTGLTSLTIRPGVKEIGHCAFWYCEGLGSVTLPPGVESVGSWAFADCGGLKAVTIPSSVTNIGERAFGRCGAIRTFVVDEENAHYSSKNGMLCSKDGSVLIAGVNGVVTIPSSVTSIDRWAFEGRGGLVSFAVDPGNTNYSSRSGLLCTKDGGELVVGINGDVTIPSCVTNVMKMAFFYREGLKSVSIPSSVVNVGELSFAGCSELMSFTVDDANANYSGRNGLLCSKDGSVLVAGINGDVTVPSCVTKIGSSSFYNRRGLKSLIIPSSVTNIDWHAFFCCTNLTSVTIPSSVVNIDREAFDRCHNLKTIHVVSDGGVNAMSFDDFCKERNLGRYGQSPGLSRQLKGGLKDLRPAASGVLLRRSGLQGQSPERPSRKAIQPKAVE